MVDTIILGTRRVPVRSAYRHQVHRFAQQPLLDRGQELQELAAFCTEPDRDPYLWWRAPEWSGKSALLSTFVLDPPPGIWVASFFITARFAGQDTREAFIYVLVEQLAEFLDQDLPVLLPFTAETHLLRMLEEAAHLCAQRDERLILVVDGLDEDRSLLRPGAHSIAALLPARPAHGMRVVVAGRTNPPVPDDVPAGHPLHDPGIVRILSESKHAKDIKKHAEQEVRNLSLGTPEQQDLLGLLTAARGGLSGPDLAELTDHPLWQIGDVLHGVSGRTFNRSTSRWNPDSSPEVYLLGHEELHRQAHSYLDPERWNRYRDRLHAWAQTYRTRNPSWPQGTPEYLLGGYFRLLTTTGDLPRILTYATDTARHDRMLDLSGGDSTALSEVSTAFTLLDAHEEPDLLAALRLARHRDTLIQRNANIPPDLPALWARLGHHARAETLARSISDPQDQTAALASVTQVLAEDGRHQQAESCARSITTPYRRASALCVVSGSLIAQGQHEDAMTLISQAWALARSITDHDSRDLALSAVVTAFTTAGQFALAESVSRAITSVDQQVRAVVVVAEALVVAGRYEQGEAMIRAIAAPHDQVLVLSTLALSLMETGQYQRAAVVILEVERATETRPHPDRETASITVAGILAAVGRYTSAEALAATIGTPYLRAMALSNIVTALARDGQHERAETLTRDVEQHLTDAGIVVEPLRLEVFKTVAAILTGAGQHRQVEILIRSITDPAQRVQILCTVARAAQRGGQHQRVETLAAEAELLARAITHPSARVNAMFAVAQVWADVGQNQRCEVLAGDVEAAARAVQYSYQQDDEMTALTGVLAASGHHREAEAAARSITSTIDHARALCTVARGLFHSGEQNRARALVAEVETSGRALSCPAVRAVVLSCAAQEFAAIGYRQRGHQVALAAEIGARQIADPNGQAEALGVVAAAITACGEHQHAEALARSIPELDWRIDALAAVSKVLLSAGHHDHAETIARSITQTDRQASLLCAVAEDLAAVGRHAHAVSVVIAAEALVRSITDANQQAQALSVLAATLALVGPRQHAQAVVLEAELAAYAVIEPFWRDEVFSILVGPLAALGYDRRAEAAVRATSDPFRQADMLITISRASTAIGDTNSARRAALRACGAGRWIQALDVIVQLDPTAIDILTGHGATYGPNS